MPKYQITISALDQASAKIEAINKKILSITEPLQQVQKSLGRFAKASGLAALGRGFRDIAKASLRAFESITRMVAPLGAITAAASAAGMGKLVSSWGNWGTQLKFNSQRLKMSASDLYDWQNAARLGGVSAEAMTGGLDALGQTARNALTGDGAARAMLNTLGIEPGSIGNVSKNVDMMAKLADKVKSLYATDPQAAERAVAGLGISPDLLPILAQGSAGLQNLIQDARTYNTTTDQGVDNAREFEKAQTGLSIAFDGLGHSIAGSLAPALTPLIEQFAHWVATSPALQQSLRDLSAWAKSISFDDVKAGLISVKTHVMDVITAMGGLKTATEITLGLWAFSKVSPLLLTMGQIALWIGRIGLAISSVAALALGLPAWVVGLITGAVVVGAVGTYEGNKTLSRETGGAVVGVDPMTGIPIYANPSDAPSLNPFPHSTAPRVPQGQPRMSLPVPNAADLSHGSASSFLPLIRRLENSGDSAVSPAGAIGRYQIMPATARSLGFDPSRLMDPAYNQQVAIAALMDLQRQHGGNVDEIIAGYNASPGAVARFHAANDNPSVLPPETQRYLARAHRLMAQGMSVTAPAAAGPAASLSSGANDASGGAQSRILLDIHNHNAQPGTAIRMKSDDPSITLGSLKIERAMPGFAAA